MTIVQLVTTVDRAHEIKTNTTRKINGHMIRISEFMNADVGALTAAFCALVLAFFKGSNFRNELDTLKASVVWEKQFIEYKEANKEQHEDIKGDIKTLGDKLDILLMRGNSSPEG